MTRPASTPPGLPPALSRRERQVMEILFRLGSGTAAEILAALPDPPSDSAIRFVLRTLTTKGHVTHAWDGPRYVYHPTAPRSQAGRAQVRQMLETFFEGEPERLVATLLEEHERDLDPAALDRLAAMIDVARKREKKKR